MNSSTRTLIARMREAGLAVAYKHLNSGGFRVTVTKERTREIMTTIMDGDLDTAVRTAATHAGFCSESEMTPTRTGDAQD